MIRRLRTAAASDRGLAMLTVVMFGSALVLMSAVVLARGISQYGNTRGDALWEQALGAAEGGLSVGLARVEADPEYVTDGAMPSEITGTADEKPWVVDTADAAAATDLGVVSDGEYVIVRPDGSSYLYSVGFAPARAAPERRVRVVRVTLDLTPAEVAFQLNYAFLTNDDLEINGNPTFHGAAASAHTNGFVDVPGNPTFQDGCLTASNGGQVGGNLNVHSNCPPDSERFTQPEVFIPEIVPRDFWYLSEYDMCPDGKVRAGPAHPTLGSTAGSDPCTTGSVLSQDASNPYRGWKFNGCCDSKEHAKWDYDSNSAYDGAYYFHQGTVRVPKGPGSNNNPWNVTMIVEAVGTCPNLVGGDVYLSGNMAMAPYQAGSEHAGNNLAVVAGRDVEWSGNGKLKEPGIVAAHEQIKINGNPDVDGGFIAEGACNSVEDNIQETFISGNPVFRNDGPLGTPWTISTGAPGFAFDAWLELT